jgi:hypothetical protein
MTQRIILLGILALSCSGCPPIVKTEGMTAQVAGPYRQGTADVLVTVFGAAEHSDRKAVQFTNDRFAQALATSLERSGLFRKAFLDTPGQYQLQANVTDVQEEVLGINLTASMTISYVLARMSPKALVWEKSITSSHTAGIGDSVISITRLQMATEGAARKNIEEVIRDLSMVKLE